jgi:hypothetical protein
MIERLHASAARLREMTACARSLNTRLATKRDITSHHGLTRHDFGQDVAVCNA